MIYSENVIKLLKANGISGYRLAKEIGVSTNTATNWVANGKVPYKFALKIARYLGVSVERLLDDEVEVTALKPTS